MYRVLSSDWTARCQLPPPTAPHKKVYVGPWAPKGEPRAGLEPAHLPCCAQSAAQSFWKVDAEPLSATRCQWKRGFNHECLRNFQLQPPPRSRRVGFVDARRRVIGTGHCRAKRDIQPGAWHRRIADVPGSGSITSRPARRGLCSNERHLVVQGRCHVWQCRLVEKVGRQHVRGHAGRCCKRMADLRAVRALER